MESFFSLLTIGDKIKIFALHVDTREIWRDKVLIQQDLDCVS